MHLIFSAPCDFTSDPSLPLTPENRESGVDTSTYVISDIRLNRARNLLYGVSVSLHCNNIYKSKWFESKLFILLTRRQPIIPKGWIHYNIVMQMKYHLHRTSSNVASVPHRPMHLEHQTSNHAHAYPFFILYLSHVLITSLRAACISCHSHIISLPFKSSVLRCAIINFGIYFYPRESHQAAKNFLTIAAFWFIRHLSLKFFLHIWVIVLNHIHRPLRTYYYPTPSHPYHHLWESL